MIHQLVRSDSEASERVRRKIGTEAEHWAAIEKDAAQQKRRGIQIDQEVAEAELQHAYLQRKEPEKIQAAQRRKGDPGIERRKKKKKRMQPKKAPVMEKLMNQSLSSIPIVLPSFRTAQELQSLLTQVQVAI